MTGNGAYVWAYMLFILGIVLGLMVVCRSAGRRDRAKPEDYVESSLAEDNRSQQRKKIVDDLPFCRHRDSLGRSGFSIRGRRVLPLPYQQQKLANGLTLIMIPMPSPGLVAYFTVVRTGSRDEVEPGRSGFAHFFEHMMFRGTKKHPGSGLRPHRHQHRRPGQRLDHATTSPCSISPSPRKTWRR